MSSDLDEDKVCYPKPYCFDIIILCRKYLSFFFFILFSNSIYILLIYLQVTSPKDQAAGEFSSQPVKKTGLQTPPTQL